MIGLGMRTKSKEKLLVNNEQRNQNRSTKRMKKASFHSSSFAYLADYEP